MKNIKIYRYEHLSEVRPEMQVDFKLFNFNSVSKEDQIYLTKTIAKDITLKYCQEYLWFKQQ